MLKEPSSFDLIVAILVVVFGASGTYLLLPHRLGSATPRKVYTAGAVLAVLGLLAFLLFLKPPGEFLTSLFFYAFSIAAVAGAILTVTSRDPIHSALWFASVILSTSGLFLLAGAQFLAAGTVIVYAGAIIVTFLFVIMLAQMEGRAIYDRAARAPGRATFTCFLLLWGLLYALLTVRAIPGKAADPNLIITDAKTASPTLVTDAEQRRLVPTERIVAVNRYAPGHPATRLLARVVHDTNKLNDQAGAPKPHVAGLGESLYTDNLIAVELAGGLLFAALIGALAIATPKAPIRPGVKVPTPSLEI